jgi:hypothetical protein
VKTLLLFTLLGVGQPDIKDYVEFQRQIQRDYKDNGITEDRPTVIWLGKVPDYAFDVWSGTKTKLQHCQKHDFQGSSEGVVIGKWYDGELSVWGKLDYCDPICLQKEISRVLTEHYSASLPILVQPQPQIVQYQPVFAQPRPVFYPKPQSIDCPTCPKARR